MKILTALEIIPRDSDYDKKISYNIENSPKHVDRKSIIWSSTYKGQLYQGNKFLNRKYKTHVDTQNNRIAKKRALEILKRLEDLKTEVSLEIAHLDKLTAESHRNYALYEQELLSIQNVITVTYDYKKRIENSKRHEEAKINKYQQDYKQLAELYEAARLSIRKLKGVINNSFWLQISHHMARGSIRTMSRGYLMFDYLYKSFQQLEKGKKKNQQINPKLKPTWLVYEYFVFFVAIDSLLSLGFKFPKHDDLQEQLLSSFYYNEGLVDGTIVKLVSREFGFSIDVVYNEEVETSSESALRKNKHFFTNRFNKKPDIKIDLYGNKNGEKKFLSSFIFEVKYRPLENIYHPKGSTKVMEQMDFYRAINYVKDYGVFCK